MAALAVLLALARLLSPPSKPRQPPTHRRAGAGRRPPSALPRLLKQRLANPDPATLRQCSRSSLLTRASYVMPSREIYDTWKCHTHDAAGHSMSGWHFNHMN
jgi:hypothetical protein